MVRTIERTQAEKGTKAWDIECVGNHNFIAGKILGIFSNTNNPEFEKLRGDQTMEALRDRTVKIDVPYLLEWRKELAILEAYYGHGRVRQHIAPHTLEIAALWAVLTRLEDDKDHKLTPVQKAKLYDGRAMPG
jgi:serine protein kinase